MIYCFHHKKSYLNDVGLFYGLIDNGLLAADSIGNMLTNLPTHIKEQISDMKKDEEKE